MKRESFFLIFHGIVLAFGFGLVITGYGLFCRITSSDLSVRQTQHNGILFFSSEKLDVAEIDIIVQNLNVEENSAEVNIVIAVYSPPPSFVFGFQFPHMLISNSSRLNSTYVREWDSSVAYIVFSSNEFLYYSKTLHVTWKGCLHRQSFSRYSIDVPFEYFPSTEMIKETLMSEVQTLNMWNINRYNLAIMPPEDGPIVFVSPQPSVAYYATSSRLGEAALYFNLRDMQSSIQSFGASRGQYIELIGIRADFEIVSLVAQQNIHMFLSGLFLGTGIPLAISSLYELIKMWPRSAVRKVCVPQNMPCHMTPSSESIRAKKI